MRRITRVLLALVLAPAALLVLWLVVWGGVFLSGTLNGAYALPVDEPNRLFIVLPEERPGSLLFLAYGCVGGQRRVLQDNTWTVSFNRRGLACTTDAPFVIKGGSTGRSSTAMPEGRIWLCLSSRPLRAPRSMT